MQNIQDRSFEFALRIVRLHDYLNTKRGAARIIARQVLKSGTSVGANLEEASGAQSKADRTAGKLEQLARIARNEAR